ncbi:hypothetical protein CNR22_15435 [Sphingobacteriaceae bacterium]|nr:hypothetical protein CNR22_15435 [Sphingobacteriaceae bacterium]
MLSKTVGFIKYLLPVLLVASCQLKKLSTNEKKLVEANHAMKTPAHLYLSCVIQNDLDTCSAVFKKKAKSPYEKNAVANTLFSIDPDVAYEYHRQAYKSKPNELYFILEYAIEEHRRGNYAEAADLYKQFSDAFPENFRVKVWLADCYMNIGKVEKSIQYWVEADHAKHHIEIETAIHEIYGAKNLYIKRNFYRSEIKKGNLNFFYDLFYLDLNWEFDWWNQGVVDQEFLNADIALANEKLDKKSEIYSLIEAYVKIKTPEGTNTMKSLSDVKSERPPLEETDIVSDVYNKTMAEVEKEIQDMINASIVEEDTLVKNQNESLDQQQYIKNILVTYSFVVDGKPLPPNGKVASDFLEVCFTNSLLTKSDVFRIRGEEILEKSEELHDVEFLNLYAHVMPVDHQKLAETDKKGWKEYKDERFAWTYLMLGLLNRKLNVEELDQAIVDFPNSSRIYLIKTQKAKLDKKQMTNYFTELIKKEFRTLDSGVGLGASYSRGHSSYPLKLYFELLRKELRTSK